MESLYRKTVGMSSVFVDGLGARRQAPRRGRVRGNKDPWWHGLNSTTGCSAIAMHYIACFLTVSTVGGVL